MEVNEQIQINLEMALNHALDRVYQLEKELILQKAISEGLLLENKGLKSQIEKLKQNILML